MLAGRRTRVCSSPGSEREKRNGGGRNSRKRFVLRKQKWRRQKLIRIFLYKSSEVGLVSQVADTASKRRNQCCDFERERDGDDEASC